MRLTFVRHGESTANAEGRLQGRAEFELSDVGRTQARALHDRFKGEGFQPTHIYSSPQRRTAETARIVSASWPLTISYSDDLKEHDIGIFSGLTWSEISSRFPEVAAEYEESGNWDVVEGAETLAQRRSRGSRLVESLLDRHGNDDRVLVFTHGGILAFMIASLLGTDRTWGLGAQNTGIFDFSLDLERWSQDGNLLHNSALWRISRFNDASHVSSVQ
ncbi:MAG: histidine phosphatase family protein [Chloroflexi bacterium]|nr:histidine phosphatase family protein [Chloroflexota bacterium]